MTSLPDATPDQPVLETLVSELERLRQEASESDKHTKALRAEKTDIETRIRDTMKAMGLDSVSVLGRTLTPYPVESFRVADPAAWWDWVKEREMWFMCKSTVEPDAVREYLETSNGELPPGIETSTAERLGNTAAGKRKQNAK